MMHYGLCTPKRNNGGSQESNRVPVDRDTLLKIYGYMKCAYREIEDEDDYLPIKIPIFDKFEIDEVRRALRRKKI